MPNQPNIFNKQEELFITRCGNGIKLIADRNISYLSSLSTILSVPLNTYFLNKESLLQNMNETAAETHGFISIKNGIGKSVLDVFEKSDALSVISNNTNVMKNNRVHFIEESAVRHYDDFDIHCLSIKFPWYDERHKIIGVFGFSIPLGKKTEYFLSDYFSFLYQSKLLRLPYDLINLSEKLPIGVQLNDFYLSRRECDILRLLVRGKTANEISIILHLSKRTVENYLAKIKAKMNVSSRSELIDKVIDFIK